MRTLAPAPSDKVWVELIPPDGERRVRLVGRVAWSRPFGSPGGEAAPPGFGVRIVDGLGEDLSLWSMCLRSLEFRAPATLVPEARFSTPMSRLSSPDDLRPYIVTQGDRLTPPPPQSVADAARSPALQDASRPTPNDASPTVTSEDQGTNNPDDVVATSVRSNVTLPKAPSGGVNLSNPPASLPLSRLRNPAQVSTRPSLRLSVPGPSGVRRDSLLRSGKLSRPPGEETSLPERVGVPSRPGQGQTVLGLGLLKRDGSVSDNQARPAVLPPKHVDEYPTPADKSLDPYIVSPVTGRTLNYGSDTPAPIQDRPTFPPNSWDDDTTRTSLIDDISDRPTLTDRLSAPQNSQPSNAFGASGQANHSNERRSTSPEALDSLPPDALESDAPTASPESSTKAPLLRRDPVARTYFGEPPGTTSLTETDRDWPDLGGEAEDLFTAAEKELESATQRASIPTSGTLPGFSSPVAPASVSGARAALISGEIAPDTDPDAPLTTPDNEPLSPFERSIDESPFEAARLTPLPPTKELPKVGATQTLTAVAPRPKRAVWFVVAAALCAALALVVLAKRSQVRASRNVNATAVPQEANEPNSTPSVAVALPGALPADESPSKSTPDAVPEQPTEPIPSVAVAAITTTAADRTPSVASIAAPAEPVGAMSAASTHPAISSPAPSPALSPDSDTAPTPPPVVVQTTTSPPKNPQELSLKSAWLFVRSELDARVFVHGVDSGVTNTWIETPCGTRFVRLGRSAGDWLGPGFATVIRCRNNNIVEGVAK